MIDKSLAIDHAKKIGTYGQADRSRQYPLNTEKQIIEAVNLALTKVRSVEKAKDEDIARVRAENKRYRLMNSTLTSIIAVLAWKGLEALIAHLPPLLSR